MKTDREIQRDVISELQFDPSIRAEAIGVSVVGQVVTLTGYVPTYAEKNAAESAAFRVIGVKAVVENLKVNLQGSAYRRDEDIAKAASLALSWHSSLTAPIQVTVSRGEITLRGDVEWEYQRNAAENSVRFLKGVTGVNNLILVGKRRTIGSVKEKIEGALQRHFANCAKNISVQMSGSKVVLSGEVHSRGELDDVCRSAWSVPGVESIENHLRIV